MKGQKRAYFTVLVPRLFSSTDEDEENRAFALNVLEHRLAKYRTRMREGMAPQHHAELEPMLDAETAHAWDDVLKARAKDIEVFDAMTVATPAARRWS